MSYKHLDHIQSLYESVSEKENGEHELVEEIITVVSTSMFAEGYSTTAIKSYFDCADPVEIIEKYNTYSEDFSFIDEKTLNEDADDYLILDEEGLIELNLVIEGIPSLIKAGIKRVAAPTMRAIGRGGRTKIKSAISAVKNKVGGGVKAVSKKADDVGKSKNWTGGANPAGKPSVTGSKGGPLATISKTKTKVKDATKTAATNVKGKVDDVIKNVKTAAKTPVKSAKTALGKVGNIVKKNAPLAGAITVGGVVGAKLTGNSKKTKAKDVHSDAKAKDTHTDAQGKKYPSTAEIRAKQSKSSSTGNAGSSTDSGGTAGKTTVTPKPEDKTSERDAWLKKTRNSPAAKSGAFSDDQRWAQQLKHRKWQKENKRGKYKESYDAFDIVSNYLIDSNQVDGMDEALYVMTEMDAQTIQGIVEDFKKKA